MPNITTAINDQIRRLARREISSHTRATRRHSAQHRHDIAALKRQVAELQKIISFLQQQEKRRVVREPVPPENGQGMRFRADGLKSHRSKLGLSARDYGRLVGVSGLSIYHWEGGKSRPRREQLPKLAAVRKLGKREAHQRLEMLDGPMAFH
jgi:DNA-binding transcriptional regulator YiaG